MGVINGLANDDVVVGLERELDALWRFGLKLTGNQDDAADLVQRTCLRALEQRQNYKSQGRMRSWLFSIEHRIWLNELRSRKVRESHALNTQNGTVTIMPGVSMTLEETYSSDNPETTVLLEQVYDVVETLPEAQRIIMILVCVEGFAYREVAEILDLPVGTVMSRLARARVSVGQRVLGKQRSYSDTKRGELES